MLPSPAAILMPKPWLWPAVARVVSGGIFFVFGLGKFTDHAKETASFETYGLPAPEVFVYAIGTLEIVSGLLLVAGLATRLVAPALAGNMLGAIVTAGRVEGGAINLGLAPALLVVMLVLTWTGAGRFSADERLVRRLH
jgi:putative oxidoreductase